MSDQFVGEIRVVGFNFAPQGWAICNGQLLAISQNAALFSLLGTQFGGDGKTTFALPNFNARFPMHFGQGPGLSAYNIGEQAGQAQVTLTAANLPSHTHTIGVSTSPAVTTAPGQGVLASSVAYTEGAPNVAMAPGALAASGGGNPMPTLPPYLCLNFIIALTGIFPARS